jgi:S1-C subfamily serine protease
LAGRPSDSPPRLGQPRLRLHSDTANVGLPGIKNAQVQSCSFIPVNATSSPHAEESSVSSTQEDGFHIMDSVVKVFCIHTQPNYSLPWQRKRQYSSTSSGFMVKGPHGENWLLTNAHSVEYHSQVKIKKRGDDKKFIATVLSIGEECDIALLSVEDEEFWANTAPLSFGCLPTLQDSVYVIGYPIGGDTISVTSGVVSRIEVTPYAHGGSELLAVQIDAAINSGNSGGPVLSDHGDCIGIAFQSYAGSDAENIGYVIPVPVIEHFLQDYEVHGAFTGFPSIGIQWQRMESQALRTSAGMLPGQHGVMIRNVQPIGDAAKKLQVGDILMSFDGIQVANEGTVPFRSGERIAFSYLTSQKFSGDTCELVLLRNREEIVRSVTLQQYTGLIPHHLSGGDPSYLVVAGIIFTTATEPYFMSEYGAEYHREAPVKLLDRMLHHHKTTEDEEVVLVSQVLACDATLGYEDGYNAQVKAFNGTPIRNLRQLAKLVLECQEPLMTFEMEYNELIVLDTESAKKATGEILDKHSIPSVVSKNMRDLLE